jgi:FkbM family methyltransferase
MRPFRQAHGSRPAIDALHDREMALANTAIEADSGATGDTIAHRARHFAVLPDRNQATALLLELATTPCPFGLPAPGRPLALYGAGNLGRLARNFVQAVGRDVAMVLDRNAHAMADDPAWIGIALRHPDEVQERDKRHLLFAVCVATSPYVPLQRSLHEIGFRHVVPFYDWAENFRDRHPLSNGWFAPPLAAADRTATGEVLSRWDDDTSRAHHLQFLAWRRLREEWTFEDAPVPDCERFFIPAVTQVLHERESLLDGGAHHGLVSEALASHTGGRFAQIVAIEPDPASRGTMTGRLRSALGQDPRVAVVDCALGERSGDALFHGGLDYASQLSSTGTMTVQVRTIDSLGVSPSFIKLHLEGHELSALKGARETLARCRPIVAVTVYHNADGIWKTPAWLMETLPASRFLFRVHSWCGTGAVVYAIPHERTA